MYHKEDKYTAKQKLISRYAKALGHPVRVQILQFLGNEACCYSGDLAEQLPIARSTLSQHLNELKNAGLIKGEIDLPRIKYCIDHKKWDEAKSLFSSFFESKSILNEERC